MQRSITAIALRTDSMPHHGNFFYKGHYFRASIVDDDSLGAPWDEQPELIDIVSEWTGREQLPREWLIEQDRNDSRFYDHEAAVHVARRDGWTLTECQKVELLKRLNLTDQNRRHMGEGLTDDDVTREAVARNFEWCRAYGNNEWSYVRVHVALLDACEEETPLESTVYRVEYECAPNGGAGDVTQACIAGADDIIATFGPLLYHPSAMDE